MSSMIGSTVHKNTAGFTIVELLVSVLVISILIGIAVPVLSNSRKAARRVVCLSNCGQLALLLHSYATDNRDSFPSWFPETTQPNAAGPYHAQSVYLMSYRKWSDYCGIPFRDGILHCPGNPHGRWTGGSQSGLIEYFLSSSFWLAPGYLNPELPPSVWRNINGARVQKLSSVRFPSAKIGVYEFYVMHGKLADLTLNNADYGPFIFTISAERGSAAFLDGHAFFPDPLKSLPFVDRLPEHLGPYDTTEWGIYGRDY